MKGGVITVEIVTTTEEIIKEAVTTALCTMIVDIGDKEIEDIVNETIKCIRN